MAWKCRSVKRMIFASAISSRRMMLMRSNCFCSGVQGSDRLHYSAPAVYLHSCEHELHNPILVDNDSQWLSLLTCER